MSYSGKLGHRRYEGYAEHHALTAMSATLRSKHIGGVAAPKAPHREIEGAHLRRGRITLDLIEREYLRNLGEE